MSNIYLDRPPPDLRGLSADDQTRIAEDALSRTANALSGLVLLLEAHSETAFSGLAALVKGIEDDAWLGLSMVSDLKKVK